MRASEFTVDSEEPGRVPDEFLLVDSRMAARRQEREYRLEHVWHGPWEDHSVTGVSAPGCEGVPGRFDIRAVDELCLLEVRVRVLLNPMEEPVGEGFESMDPVNCPHAGSVATADAVRERARTWREVIRDTWSRKYRIRALDPACPCPAYDVDVAPQFVDLGEEQHQVRVHSGCEATRIDSANWYMGMSNLTAAHEFGHLLGLDDEYWGSCVVTSGRSIMWAPDIVNLIAPGTSKVQLFHYHHFAEWLSANRPCQFEVGRIEDIPTSLWGKGAGSFLEAALDAVF
ncbi:MAG: hypothetical protein HY996_00595 [Micrococcales bacterium]|nr:hypothetical protein [Micrococcales bacterium]